VLFPHFQKGLLLFFDVATARKGNLTMRQRSLVWVMFWLVVLGVAATAQANLVQNWQFTDGLSQWNFSGDVTVGSAPVADTLMSGQYALLGAGTTNGVSALSQSFSTFGLTQLAVSFDWYFKYTDVAPTVDKFAAFMVEGGIGIPLFITYDLLKSYSANLGTTETTVSGHFAHTYDLSTWLPLGGSVAFVLDEAWFGNVVSQAGVDNVSVAAPVPEPGTLLLLGSGLLGLGGFACRRNRKG
jgi:hypothetical protein